MCYFPEKIYNKRFLPTRKNNYQPERCYDERLRYIEVECGQCFECRKKKRNQWRLRNYEELREFKHAIFFTGTLSPERYKYLCEHYGYREDEENSIITKELRLFLERIRKSCHHSIRHWCVTEKGHQNTRRIHLHGIFYLPKGMRYKKLLGLLYNNWIGGYCYYGDRVDNKTINYISKYMTKTDKDNPDYRSIVLCTKGIGRNYQKRCGWRHKWEGPEKTKDNYYDQRTGRCYPLPRYWRQKIFNQWERDQLLLNRLDKKTEWFDNFKWDVSTEKGMTELQNYKKEYRERWAAIHGDIFAEIMKRKLNNQRIKKQKYKEAMYTEEQKKKIQKEWTERSAIVMKRVEEDTKKWNEDVKRIKRGENIFDDAWYGYDKVTRSFKDHAKNILEGIQAETASGVDEKEAAGYWEWVESDYQGDLFAYTAYPANRS